MRTVPLYPYEVSELLTIRLTDFDDPATGAAVTVREIGWDDAEDSDEPRRSGPVSYDVTSSTIWQKLTFRLVAELSRDEIDRVLPSTSEVAADTSLVVLVMCPATRYRHGVRLRAAGAGRWTAHASIQREDVRGSLILRPQLVRTSSIPTTEALPYATRAGAVIAVGEPTTMFLDTHPKLGLSSSVLMTWEDFANSDDLWRREHPDDVYHLEPYGAMPRLWLNSRYGQLRDILDSTAKRGPEAVLRDMVAVLVAQPVMMQLCTSALASLEVDEDSGSVSPPSGWRADMLATILPRLYPEEPGEDERLRRAATEFSEADGSASLTARLGTVVQGIVSSYKTVEAAVRAFETVRDNEESRDD